MKKAGTKIIALSVDQYKGGEVDWERKQDVTIEDVIAEKEMQHLTREQAEEVIQFIKTFSMLLYNVLLKEMKETSAEEVQVISLHDNTNNKKAA